MKKDFDFFRLNCLLRDTKASDFKRVVVSLICEILFENDNKETSLNEIYEILINKFSLNIQRDYFDNLISENTNFQIAKIDNDSLIKLNTEKYAKINDSLTENSIDIHINTFLKDSGYSLENLEHIKSMLFSAIYENISSFSTENINNVLSQSISNGYSQEQIDVFNEFLDSENHQKNTAVYAVFLKAIEFAILTSGRGVKNFSKDIFKNKTYCLDTNVIFRLLGVGGFERQQALLKLIKSCVHQGISFKYTAPTYQEFKRKISQSVITLNKINDNDARIIGDLTDSNNSLFSDDFVSHYSKLRKNKEIYNAQQYETYMLQKFREIERQFKFELGVPKPELVQKEGNKLATILFEKRNSRNYTKSASKVDAYNVLYVRKLRDANNHNYSDVKSFYLSTDRTLNKILGSIERILIPESILPSQLYILHNPFSEDDDRVDYELFLNFLKKRSTEFKYKGREVFTFIDEIRKYTSNEEAIKDALEIFANQRFEQSNNFDVEQHPRLSIKNFAETHFDKILLDADNDREKLENISRNANKEVNKALRFSKNIVRTIDVMLIACVIPVLGFLLGKFFEKEIFISTIIIVLLELTKYMLQIQTNFMVKVCRKVYLNRIKNSNYFKLTNDLEFIDNNIDKFNNEVIGIWK